MTHHQGLVIAQTEVGVKTNEIPMLPTLLDEVNIADAVITADALHTQRATARYLHNRRAEFVFCVKKNQPKLFACPDALPWKDTPIGYSETDRGHGRITTRTIQVLPAPDDLPFPHVHQVFLLERYVTDVTGSATSAVAVLGITSQTANQADAPSLADAVRGPWGIESLHWLRDTVYRDDDSTVRTRSDPGPRPPCATSRSEHYAWPDAPTSPKPPDGPAADPTDHSPFSNSQHDLETAVTPLEWVR